MPRNAMAIRGIVLVASTLVGMTTLAACDPPMPPDVAAAVAERQLTCVPGAVSVSVPADFTGSMAAVGDALASACVEEGVDQTASEVADDPSAPVRVIPGPPTSEQLEEFRTSACTTGTVLAVPAFAYPISLAFNAPGFEGIALSAEAVAGILNGTITSFADPAIQATNEGYDFSSLPPISVVASGQPSGAVEAMTAWLAQQAPQVWSAGAVATLPAAEPLADQAALLETMIATPSAVTVLPVNVALNNGLGYASLVTMIPGAEGQPVQAVPMSPDDPQLAKIGAGATTILSETPDALTVSAGIGGIPQPDSFDLAASKIVLAEGQPVAGWPVVGMAHLLVCDDASDPLPTAFAQYVVRLAGQGALETNGLIPLPEPIRLKTFAPLRVVVDPTDIPSDLFSTAEPSMPS